MAQTLMLKVVDMALLFKLPAIKARLIMCNCSWPTAQMSMPTVGNMAMLFKPPAWMAAYTVGHLAT